MVKKRIVDNRNRPAQPEPDEDPATKAPPVREVAKKVLKKTTRQSK